MVWQLQRQIEKADFAAHYEQVLRELEMRARVGRQLEEQQEEVNARLAGEIETLGHRVFILEQVLQRSGGLRGSRTALAEMEMLAGSVEQAGVELALEMGELKGRAYENMEGLGHG